MRCNYQLIQSVETFKHTTEKHEQIVEHISKFGINQTIYENREVLNRMTISRVFPCDRIIQTYESNWDSR